MTSSLLPHDQLAGLVGYAAGLCAAIQPAAGAGRGDAGGQ